MTTIRIQLNRDALEALQRPVVGRGGFQSLLQQLQAQVQPSGHLELSPELVARLARYAQRYGRGGFQGRLDTVLDELTALAGALMPLAA